MSTVPAETLALQRLYHWEATAPERVILTQPLRDARGALVVRDYTWRQVMDEARRMAAHLRSLGLPQGSAVALLSKNCAHWLIADFAIWLGGYVSVPLYPTLAAETIRQILEHSEAKLLFVGKLDGWEAMKPGVPAGLPCIALPLGPTPGPKAGPGSPGELSPLAATEGGHDSPPTGDAKWDDLIARTQPLPGQPLREGDALSTIMYTSGTTGMPKGVMHSFATFAWSVKTGLQRLQSIDQRTRMLSYLPLAHVAERTLVEHGLLATSMHIFFAEALETFTRDLQRARPTAFFSVPRLWVKFQQGVSAKMPPEKLARLLKLPIIKGIVRKKILSALGLDQCEFAAGGAAPMPPELLRWYAALGLPIVEVYGMTENCGVSHATLQGVQRPGTVGLPYDGVQARIDPGNGEIQVKSEGTMLGYFKEPELTKQAFTDDGYLHTGDKGQLDGEGNLRITGRVKDLFKTSKGKYVAPAPIEDKLVMHTAVEACCVTGANLGQPLGLVMLSAEGLQRPRESLQASLEAHLGEVNAKLDPHEQMLCLVVVSTPWTVESGFITPTFKVKRNRIEEAYGANYERWERAGQKVVWA
jgi:long-chain acyl-CoA synthetase